MLTYIVYILQLYSTIETVDWPIVRAFLSLRYLLFFEAKEGQVEVIFVVISCAENFLLTVVLSVDLNVCRIVYGKFSKEQ